MHVLILAKQWTAEAQSYKYRDLLFGFEAFQKLIWFQLLSLYTWSNCCSWHSIGAGGGAESPILS